MSQLISGICSVTKYRRLMSSVQRGRVRPNLILILFLILGVYILTSGDLIPYFLPPAPPSPSDSTPEYVYELEEGLESLGGLEGTPGNDELLSDRDPILKLTLDLQELPRPDPPGATQGIILGLRTEGSIVESLHNFVELECIADLLGYRVVLPSVHNGKYSTLHCGTDVDYSLPLSRYFNIDRANVFLDSFRLPGFSNLTAGLLRAPSSVLLVFFVYSDDVVVFPDSSAGSFARDSLFPSEGPRNYVRDCSKYLDPVSHCVTQELTQLGGKEFLLERAVCVDANLPISRKQFASYLGLGGEQKTLVLVNWNGMKPPNAPGAKATFLDVKNRYTSKCRPPITIPFSDEVTFHTNEFLESWGLYAKDYVSIYIDLQLIMNERSNTTDCLERIGSFIRWWFVAEYPNRLAFITSPEFVDYPDRQAVHDKYTEIEEVLRDKAFIAKVEPPEVMSNEGKMVRDHGFAFLVETNLLSLSTGLLIAGPARLSSSFPVRSYFYNQHVHDFDFVMHLFPCS